MSVIGKIFGGGSSSQTVVEQANLTPEQTELINRQVQLADIQIEELSRQRKLQAKAFGGAEQAAAEIETPDPIQDELLGLQLDRIRAGGQATPEETELINQAVEQALAAGETDIERFQSQSTEQLREELAPQLGLRPGDTPILDRGARIGAEALRQQGALVSNLRGQQATSLLNFPLQRVSTLGSLTGSLQEFQSRLRQSAFTNRLQLAGARSTAGLGLAGVATPNIGPAFSGLGSTQTTSGSSTPGFGEIAGGIGATLLGLGAVFGSSREIKDIEGLVDEVKILETMKTLPVGIWNYKGDDQKHIGAFAEDFREAFGIGDGKTINIIDALGVLMAAVKALATQEGSHVAA